ncbi:hypothetical protein ACWPKS_08555 [Coraliomargarita sp. W4R72]
MHFRSLIAGITLGAIVCLALVKAFSGFKTTRNWEFDSYKFHLKEEDNVFIQNSNETKVIHVRSWGEKKEWDKMSSLRLAPNKDSYYFELTLTPDGFNAGLISKIDGKENLFLDKDGDGIFDELWKSEEGFDINYTYTPKNGSNQSGDDNSE